MLKTSRVTATKKFAAGLGLVAACFAPTLGLTSAQAAVLWDQPLSTTNDVNGFANAGNAYQSTQFTDFPTFSTYGADNFSNPVPWQINTIFVPGDVWDNDPNDLADAPLLTFAIYADAGGVPAGYPGGPAAPFASMSFAPTDAQILLSNGTSGYASNVLLNLTSPLLLPTGNWWLMFYPTMAFGDVGSYGRQLSDTTNGPVGQAINPDGGLDPNGTNWQSISLLGAPEMDLAFRLEGTALTTGVSAPATVLLMAGGLAGLGLRARRSASARKAA